MAKIRQQPMVWRNQNYGYRGQESKDRYQYTV